jgi:hypothetical protein
LQIADRGFKPAIPIQKSEINITTIEELEIQRTELNAPSAIYQSEIKIGVFHRLATAGSFQGRPLFLDANEREGGNANVANASNTNRYSQLRFYRLLFPIKST